MKQPVTRKDGRRWNAGLYDTSSYAVQIATGFGDGGGSWTRRYWFRWVAMLKAKQMLWSENRSENYGKRVIGEWKI